MPKEWNDEEVQAQIADAVRIVREDKFEAFVRGNVKQNEPVNDPPKNAPASGGNNPDPNGPKKRKSLWWGETDE